MLGVGSSTAKCSHKGCSLALPGPGPSRVCPDGMISCWHSGWLVPSSSSRQEFVSLCIVSSVTNRQLYKPSNKLIVTYVAEFTALPNSASRAQPLGNCWPVILWRALCLLLVCSLQPFCSVCEPSKATCWGGESSCTQPPQNVLSGRQLSVLETLPLVSMPA